MKTVRIVLLALGGLLLADAVLLCLISNLNLGTAFVAALGGILLAAGIWFKPLWEARWPLIALAAILVLLVGAGTALIVYGRTDTTTGKESAILVLGTGIRGDRVTTSMAARLDRALECAAKNPTALIVVSGGQGPQETISEAEAMFRYLVARGVDPARIVKEDRSTSTSENLRFTRALLDERFGSGYTVALVTSDYHVYRAAAVARAAGLDVTRAGAPEHSLPGLPARCLRETAAVLKMWVFGA